jgi:hypothetical protein
VLGAGDAAGAQPHGRGADRRAAAQPRPLALAAERPRRALRARQHRRLRARGGRRGAAIESMNVVVGERDTETPVFSDSIRHVVVNPYWNVPDGIMERKIPGHGADPNYLAKNDMEMVDGRVRQRPGPKNSLGATSSSSRTSSTCTCTTRRTATSSRARARVQQRLRAAGAARDFARMLLRLQSDRTRTARRAAANGSEQWIKLDRPLPVYLLYFTAWVQEDGTVRFHHDVYGRTRRWTSRPRRWPLRRRSSRRCLRPDGARVVRRLIEVYR